MFHQTAWDLTLQGACQTVETRRALKKPLRIKGYAIVIKQAFRPASFHMRFTLKQ
jgi:hypothetical protein